MQFLSTKIPDVILVKVPKFADHRGFFIETYHAKKFNDGGISVKFVQDNHTKSIQNTLRGLHFQVQYPQAKLVRCLRGKVFDVAVDIRKNSPYYGQWIGKELSEDNQYQLFIPDGFAHGIYVMSSRAQVLYKCSTYYHPQFQQSIRWDDPTLAIEWPLASQVPISLSDKDRQAPLFQGSFST